VDVRVQVQILAPGVQHGEKADVGAQVLRVRPKLQHRPCRRAEERAVNDAWILQGDRTQTRRQREDHVEILHRQQLAATAGDRETRRNAQRDRLILRRYQRRAYCRQANAAIYSFPMSEVTHILSAIEQGDPAAAEQLLPLVYDELRKLAAQRLAQEKPGQTLQATALVHEAFLRLVDVDKVQRWDSRGYFFAAAAEAMRRILVDAARRKASARHGGDRRRVDLDEACAVTDSPREDVLDIDDALTRLAAQDSVRAELVKLRYFAGLSMPEIATALGISLATAERHWVFARAWLYAELSEPTSEPRTP
jgi:RNA polymerase sigma factor (TIGR02999 family)